MKDEAKNVPHLPGQKLSRQAKVRGKTDKEGEKQLRMTLLGVRTCHPIHVRGFLSQ
jgi:hypothetical protein